MLPTGRRRRIGARDSYRHALDERPLVANAIDRAGVARRADDFRSQELGMISAIRHGASLKFCETKAT